MYAFCKSANMTGFKASAAYVERVPYGVVTPEDADGIRFGQSRPGQHGGDRDGDDAEREPDFSPLLSTLLAATPHAAEGLVDQTGSRILEDPEGIAARVLEDVTGSRRNLDGSTLRLPTAGPQVLRRRLQILHLEEGQARGSGTVVREEILRPFRESESGDVRPELLVVPKDRGSQDVCVVVQIALEIRSTDIEILQPTQRWSHERLNAFVGISVLGRDKP
jgi:hypothetical protein